MTHRLRKHQFSGVNLLAVCLRFFVKDVLKSVD